MNPIQTSYSYPEALLEPVAFIGLALLAGRLIQHFPGASKGGLVMAAGVSSVSSLIYDRICPDHSYLKTLCWKATVIAFATVCTGLAAKALKGRADISMQAAAKFGAVEFVFAAIIAKVTYKIFLQRHHRYFTNNIDEWLYGNVDQTAFVEAFYKNDLPALSLFDIPLRTHDFFDSSKQLFAKLDTYSIAQLSWYREILPKINIFKKKYERYFHFMMRCQECGIETLRWQIEEEALSFLEKNPRYRNMLYQEFSQMPIYRFYCNANFDDLFHDKKPLPTLEELVNTLSAHHVETMDPTFLQMWHKIFIKNPDQWKDLDASIQTAFIKHFFDSQSFQVEKVFADSPGSLTWINDLPSIDPCVLSYNQIGWIFLLGQNSQAAEKLTHETLSIIKDRYL